MAPRNWFRSSGRKQAATQFTDELGNWAFTRWSGKQGSGAYAIDFGNDHNKPFDIQEEIERGGAYYDEGMHPYSGEELAQLIGGGEWTFGEYGGSMEVGTGDLTSFEGVNNWFKDALRIDENGNFIVDDTDEADWAHGLSDKMDGDDEDVPTIRDVVSLPQQTQRSTEPQGWEVGRAVELAAPISGDNRYFGSLYSGPHRDDRDGSYYWKVLMDEGGKPGRQLSTYAEDDLQLLPENEALDRMWRMSRKIAAWFKSAIDENEFAQMMGSEGFGVGDRVAISESFPNPSMLMSYGLTFGAQGTVAEVDGDMLGINFDGRINQGQQYLDLVYLPVDVLETATGEAPALPGHTGQFYEGAMVIINDPNIGTMYHGRTGTVVRDNQDGTYDVEITHPITNEHMTLEDISTSSLIKHSRKTADWWSAGELVGEEEAYDLAWELVDAEPPPYLVDKFLIAFEGAKVRQVEQMVQWAKNLPDVQNLGQQWKALENWAAKNQKSIYKQPEWDEPGGSGQAPEDWFVGGVR